MYDTLTVRNRQRLSHSNPNLVDFVERQRALFQSLSQGLAFQKLHHQIVGAILRADVVELADVGMIQRGNGPGLALHALFQFRRRRKMRGENFDRNGTIEARVEAAVNFSHAARAQRRLDFIRPKFRASSQRHRWLQL